MKIFEFISKYCQDLVQKAKTENSLIDLEEFAHDAVIHDETGRRIPVVIVDCVDIPVSDFLTLDKKEFIKFHNTPNAAEAYDNYISAFEILEGAEALEKVRNAVLSERKRLEQDVELVTEI